MGVRRRAARPTGSAVSRTADHAAARGAPQLPPGRAGREARGAGRSRQRRRSVAARAPAAPARAEGARRRAVWRRDRKPANMFLVLDTSGSMRRQRQQLEQREGRAEAAAAPGRPPGRRRPADVLRRAADGRAAQRVTGALPRMRAAIAVWPPTAARRSTTRPRGLSTSSAGCARTTAYQRRRAAHRRRGHRLLDRVRRPPRAAGGQGDSNANVRLFTIAYGADVAGAREQLAAIARVTGGRGYEGRPRNRGRLQVDLVLLLMLRLDLYELARFAEGGVVWRSAAREAARGGRDRPRGRTGARAASTRRR